MAQPARCRRRPPDILHRFGDDEAVRAMVARGTTFSILDQVPAHDQTDDGRFVRHLRLSEPPSYSPE